MKRKASALTVILTLLFSAMAGAIFVNLAMANPAPLFSFATKPVTTSPKITVTSPLQGQTYNSTNAWLNISIVKPETWFAFDVFHHADHTPGTQTFVNITSVYYVVDNGERQNITIRDVDDLFDAVPILTLNLSTMLPLTTGAHSVKVGLEADSYYVVRYVYTLSEALSSVKLTAETDAVNFTVTKPEPQLEAEPFQTAPVATASIATIGVVGVGLLVYFKKRKNSLGKNHEKNSIKGGEA
jgi:hypothetical protein